MRSASRMSAHAEWERGAADEASAACRALAARTSQLLPVPRVGDRVECCTAGVDCREWSLVLRCAVGAVPPRLVPDLRVGRGVPSTGANHHATASLGIRPSGSAMAASCHVTGGDSARTRMVCADQVSHRSSFTDPGLGSLWRTSWVCLGTRTVPRSVFSCGLPEPSPTEVLCACAIRAPSAGVTSPCVYGPCPGSGEAVGGGSCSDRVRPCRDNHAAFLRTCAATRTRRALLWSMSVTACSSGAGSGSAPLRGTRPRTACMPHRASLCPRSDRTA